jgi:hypothetical protein
MPFSIDADDFDDLADELEEEAKPLSLQDLQRWAAEVEKEARSVAVANAATTLADSIHVVIKETEPSNFQIDYGSDKNVDPYLAKAIRNKLPEMPLKTQFFFEEFARELKKNPSET